MTRLLRDNRVNNRKYSLVEEEIKKEIKKSNDQLNILNYYIQILEDSKETYRRDISITINIVLKMLIKSKLKMKN